MPSKKSTSISNALGNTMGELDHLGVFKNGAPPEYLMFGSNLVIHFNAINTMARVLRKFAQKKGWYKKASRNDKKPFFMKRIPEKSFFIAVTILVHFVGLKLTQKLFAHPALIMNVILPLATQLIYAVYKGDATAYAAAIASLTVVKNIFDSSGGIWGRYWP